MPPLSFSVSIGTITDKTAIINWTESKDPEGSNVTYAINLNGSAVTSNLTSTTYSFASLVKNTNYTGTVTASDQAGNKTEASFSFNTTDAPVPSDFSITPGIVTNKSISFIWTASTLPGGTAVTYDVYINNVLKQAGLTVLTYSAIGLMPNTDYAVKIVAKSAEGKSLEKITTIKTNVNRAPSSFTIAQTDVGFSFVSLSSNTATDADGDTLTYYVARNGNLINEVAKNPTSTFLCTLKLLSASTNYDLTVVAVDQFGAQTSSNTVNVTTKAAPENNFIISARASSDVTVEWVANSQDRFDIAASDYEIDGVKQSLYYIQTNLQNLANNQLYVKLYIPVSKFTQNKLSNLRVNLSWGANETPTQSQINQVGVFSWAASSPTVSSALVKTYTNGSRGVVINLVNDIISNQSEWTIELIKMANAVNAGTITSSSAGNKAYAVYGSITDKEYNYLKGYSDGYMIVKDSEGYHRVNFTYSIQ